MKKILISFAALCFSINMSFAHNCPPEEKRDLRFKTGWVSVGAEVTGKVTLSQYTSICKGAVVRNTGKGEIVFQEHIHLPSAYGSYDRSIVGSTVQAGAIIENCGASIVVISDRYGDDNVVPGCVVKGGANICNEGNGLGDTAIVLQSGTFAGEIYVKEGRIHLGEVKALAGSYFTTGSDDLKKELEKNPDLRTMKEEEGGYNGGIELFNSTIGGTIINLGMGTLAGDGIKVPANCLVMVTPKSNRLDLVNTELLNEQATELEKKIAKSRGGEIQVILKVGNERMNFKVGQFSIKNGQITVKVDGKTYNFTQTQSDN